MAACRAPEAAEQPCCAPRAGYCQPTHSSKSCNLVFSPSVLRGYLHGVIPKLLLAQKWVVFGEYWQL